MQARDEIETDTPETPGVQLSYEFVIPSYEWAISRRDAANSRIQHLMIFAVSITGAAAVIAEPLGRSALSVPFGLAAACFLVAMVMGWYDLSRDTTLRLVTPSVLYAGWRDCSEAEFKNAMLKVAGSNFDKNIKGIGETAKRELWMSSLLAIEAIFLVMWLTS